MKPIKEWSLVWFWWLAFGLAMAAWLIERAIYSTVGLAVPGWLSALTQILAILVAFGGFGLQAVVWRLKQGQTDQLRTAWRWWLFCLVGGPLVVAFNMGMMSGFHGDHARHHFAWDTALWALAVFAVLSGLLFLISLGVRRVIRRLAGVA
jgi:hypothetical protein